MIFDPACYYGDREADLAMTELFGGFPAVFYDAYREAWPLDAGYAVRRDLYNLYHVLNHLNLFGGGYRSQAQGLSIGSWRSWERRPHYPTLFSLHGKVALVTGASAGIGGRWR